MKLLDQILVSRGISNDEVKNRFLNPNFDTDSYDPINLHDNEKAVVRIFEAIESNQKIAIYSDYDCDGIPGNVVFADMFRKIGYTNFIQYIPDRHKEGYGLHIDAINELYEKGVKLIITVDLGITAVESVFHASSLLIDVVITDHHEPLEVLPKAYAVVNPKLGHYPDRMLCGAGVAFKVVQLFLHKYRAYYNVPVGFEKWLLDLVAIATLSDMVPLQSENRILAFYGLKVIRKTKRIGLLQLFYKERVSIKDITEDDIVFTLSPRINAASRMADPYLALHLLQTTDLNEAIVIVEKLLAINKERKQLVMNIMKDAKKNLSERMVSDVLVIGNPNWRIGVLGLVANNLLEEYDRPVFVWGREDDGKIKGSCRSNEYFSVVELMSTHADLFEAFGGHGPAGGFTLKENSLFVLEEKLSCSIKEMEPKEKTILTQEVFEILAPDVNFEIYSDIQKLAPFGMDNKKPLLMIKNLIVDEVILFGKEKNHLKVLFYENKTGHRILGIAFFENGETYKELLLKGNNVNLFGFMEKSVFLGKTELRMRIDNIEQGYISE